jgi:hypothetical protein
MSSSFLSVLIQRQAGKYGDRVALRYRDYKTETWIPVSWNQFAATVKTVSNALIELGIGIQENIAVFSQNKPECLFLFYNRGNATLHDHHISLPDVVSGQIRKNYSFQRFIFNSSAKLSFNLELSSINRH